VTWFGSSQSAAVRLGAGQRGMSPLRFRLRPSEVCSGSFASILPCLSSAIHNNGHYYVRPRPVCLSLSCARSAKNRHSRRSSCVLASLDLATRDARAATQELGISTATNLRRTRRQSAWSDFFSDRSLAKDSAGTARSRPPTERWQDQSKLAFAAFCEGQVVVCTLIFAPRR
jgi:hypothetical protein